MEFLTIPLSPFVAILLFGVTSSILGFCLRVNSTKTIIINVVSSFGFAFLYIWITRKPENLSEFQLPLFVSFLCSLSFIGGAYMRQFREVREKRKRTEITSNTEGQFKSTVNQTGQLSSDVKPTPKNTQNKIKKFLEVIAVIILSFLIGFWFYKTPTGLTDVMVKAFFTLIFTAIFPPVIQPKPNDPPYNIFLPLSMFIAFGVGMFISQLTSVQQSLPPTGETSALPVTVKGQISYYGYDKNESKLTQHSPFAKALMPANGNIDSNMQCGFDKYNLQKESITSTFPDHFDSRIFTAVGADGLWLWIETDHPGELFLPNISTNICHFKILRSYFKPLANEPTLGVLPIR